MNGLLPEDRALVLSMMGILRFLEETRGQMEKAYLS